MIPHRRTTLRDIQNRMFENEQERVQIYESILTLIYNRIEISIKHNQLYCLYQIPEILPGKPLFNMTQCVLYIIHHFKKGGFEARYIHPFNIIIQWPQPDYMSFQARTLALENDTSTSSINNLSTSSINNIVQPESNINNTVLTYSNNIEVDRHYVHKNTQQRHRDNLMFEYIPKKVVR